MDLLVRLLVTALWLGAGALIGWKSGRRGTGMLWALAFGPLGLLLFAYGEWSRSGRREPPVSAAPAQDLNLPVQVNINGHWFEGRLGTWAQGDNAWHGWVRYSTDGADRADWFSADQMRRPETTHEDLP